MDLLLVRDERRLALIPATDLDRERVARMPKGHPFEALARFSRSSKANRWYRGLVARVAEGLGVHPDALHNDIKLKAGLVEQVLAGSFQGVVAIKLRSTSFPEMEEGEFGAYLDFAVEAICRDYLGHISAREQQKLIMEWVGRRPRLSEPPKIIAA